MSEESKENREEASRKAKLSKLKLLRYLEAKAMAYRHRQMMTRMENAHVSQIWRIVAEDIERILPSEPSGEVKGGALRKTKGGEE